MLTAALYGENLPDEPDAKALTEFLSRQKEADPERFPDLSLTVVKLMGAGEYVPLDPDEPPLGHFALAVTDYTHGTAPNRRYVDLIIQRLVKTVLDKVESPYTPEELVDQSAWLTDKEKGSKKVERFMRKAAAAVLLQDRIGTSFDALVTGAFGKRDLCPAYQSPGRRPCNAGPAWTQDWAESQGPVAQDRPVQRVYRLCLHQRRRISSSGTGSFTP